jgi:chromosome segregation ATPase
MNDTLKAENRLLQLQLHSLQNELEFYIAESNKPTITEQPDIVVHNRADTNSSVGSYVLLNRIAHTRKEGSLGQAAGELIHETPQYQALLRKLSVLEKEKADAAAALTAVRSEFQKKLSQTSDKTTTAQSKLEEALSRSETLSCEKTALQQQLDGQVSAMATLSAENSELKQRLASLPEELSHEEAKLQQKLDSQLGSMATLSAENNELKQRLTSLSEELSLKNKALQQKQENQLGAMAKVTAENNELKQRLASLDEDQSAVIDQLRAEYGKALAKLEDSDHERKLALKIVIKSQQDLDNLREKYAEKNEREQSLLELLNELRSKLEAASQFYFELKNMHPELALDQQHEHPVDPLS